MKGKKCLYEVRFRQGGKPKTFRTTARSADVAAAKIRSAGTIISVMKVK